MKNKKLFAILTLVCFMMTLMPVAAFAAVSGVGDSSVVADSLSVVWTDDKKVDSAFGEEAAFNLSLTPAVTTDAYVWVTAEGSNIPVNTVMVGVVGGAYATSGSYVYKVDSVTSGDDQFGVKFMAPGSYQVHVSTTQPTITNGAIAGASEFKAAGNVVTVVGTNDNTALFAIGLDFAPASVVESDGITSAGHTNYLEDGEIAKALSITANNVDEKIVTIKLYKDSTDAANHGTPSEVKGKAGVKIDIEPAGAITVDKTTVYTNALGEATFKVGGNRNGTYKVYLSTGRYESAIEVNVGAIVANSIESDCKTGKYDILGDTDFFKVMNFKMYDVNGNKLTPADAQAAAQGWDKAYNSEKNSYGGVDATGYVAIVEKPAASKLENDDLYLRVLTYGTTTKTTIALDGGATIDAEGVYTFKVVLDNGAYTTATVDVKEFDKPVQLVIDGANNVELGSTNTYSTIWVDAYGVKEVTTTPEFAATGYAVATFVTDTLTTKTDEKYVGSVITLTAIDQRNDLVATKEVTVAAEGQKLNFSKDTVEVNVNNTLAVSVVDANGKLVTLDGGVSTISYVILDKPEGANVFVNNLGYDPDDDVFYMTLTANKVGNVKIQAVAKYEVLAGASDDNVANVVKYYTGIQEIAVGSGQTGKSVVMSIGSNEMIAEGKVATIDAQPMIQNGRTFVPFRALAEAFGATVAYDAATSSVTAELNGVKVVMTVGSPAYTVNGISNTADVAPFISDSRTFVPVRFAAEAFGITVTPTYNADGSVADVLFNM